FTIVLFFVFFGIWAHTARLDEVTRGDGKVIPSRQIQKVQNLEGGIVAALNVSEGQTVDKNQVLLRIDNTAAKSKLKESRSKKLSLQAEIARLQAESKGRGAITFSKEIEKEAPHIIWDQRQLFEANKRQTDQQVSILRSQTEQKEQELVELKSRVAQTRQSRTLAKEELDIMAPLVRTGAVPRIDWIRSKQKLQELDKELRGIELALPRTKSAIRETKNRTDEKLAGFRTDAQREMNEKRSELARLLATIDAEADRVTRTDVLSPVRGIIKKLNVNTIGGVVQPGQDLVEIVPLDDNLLIEAKIRPADCAQLRPDLTATIKITAYDFSIHGGLPAKLIDISPDTIVDEEGNSFYRIRLRSDKNNLGKDKPIIPGMTASIDILTGHKTVLDYLMKPILKARQNALTER
ncbi:MAG: HlyD family type I secretion periplasmic adaptor subunit, partial [Proteobacteria bacterium]|nr:HlyD family type I secretion periplasmic adaptor subunit [Pseudomonadota bacterium]